MCSTYSTNSSSQVLVQSNVGPTMQSKKEQQDQLVSSVVSYNPCKQFTNVYKISDKDSPKAMAGNLKCDYPNNCRRSECLKYFHQDKIEEVNSQLHDVVMKLKNLNSPKDVHKFEVSETKPQINTIDDMDLHENNILNSAMAATECGADVVDFPSTLLYPTDSNDLASKCKNSKFLKKFFKTPKTRSPKKSPKHRNQWHKTNDLFTNYDGDKEIGVETSIDVSNLYCHHNTCTLDEFIMINKEPRTDPIDCKHAKYNSISYTISPPKKIPMSRICLKPVKKFSTAQVYCDNDFVFLEKEECYSVSPPSRGSFIRKRHPSVDSKDSFVVFDDGHSDSTESDSEDESDSEENTSSDESSTSDDESNTSDDESIFSFMNREPSALNGDSGQRKVRFADAENLEKVHVIIAWDFAYRACRKGHWEECVRDRERFRLRILRTGNCLQNIFDPEHRNRIYNERFSNNSTRFG